MPYIKYIALIGKDSGNLKDPIVTVHCLDSEPPNTPYIKLLIRIIEFEPNYDNCRVSKGFIRRFGRALRKAFKTFKVEM